jgi:predicted Zn-dependent peptidase
MKLCALVVACLLGGGAARAGEPELAFEKYALGNGLEVILHPDPAVPTVHVQVLYKVGARDDPPGRSGMAHLFEHLMFQGTRHIPDGGTYALLAQAGASLRDGVTSADETTCFETLPSNRLELALWLESSRMGFLTDRPSFARSVRGQVEIMANERRQRAAAPLAALAAAELAALYPAPHPYGRDGLGAAGDLEGVAEQDVRRFFDAHYTPGNAVLLVAGDFDPAATRALIEKYFGPLPAGAKIARPAPPQAPAPGPRALAFEAGVRDPGVLLAWPSVPLFAPGDAELQLLARVLAGGKTSRLHRRLVRDLRLAQAVSARQLGQQHAGRFEVSATGAPGATPAELVAAIEQELARLRDQPVSPAELTAARNQVRSELVRGLETLAGRAARLLQYHVFAGDAGYLGRDLARYQVVDARALQAAARKLLGPEHRISITVVPEAAAPPAGRPRRGGRS